MDLDKFLIRMRLELIVLFYLFAKVPILAVISVFNEVSESSPKSRVTI